jgi:hypothetical protein
MGSRLLITDSNTERLCNEEAPTKLGIVHREFVETKDWYPQRVFDAWFKAPTVSEGHPSASSVVVGKAASYV